MKNAGSSTCSMKAVQRRYGNLSWMSARTGKRLLPLGKRVFPGNVHFERRLKASASEEAREAGQPTEFQPIKPTNGDDDLDTERWKRFADRAAFPIHCDGSVRNDDHMDRGPWRI